MPEGHVREAHIPEGGEDLEIYTLGPLGGGGNFKTGVFSPAS